MRLLSSSYTSHSTPHPLIPLLHTHTGQPQGLDIYTDHLATSDRFLSLKRYCEFCA